MGFLGERLTYLLEDGTRCVIGDAHIYNNHNEQIDLQLSREVKELPTIKLNKSITDIFDFTYEDFELVNYNPHPLIRGKVSV